MNAALLFFVGLTWYTQGWRYGLVVIAVGIGMNVLFQVSGRYRSREEGRDGPTP
jgi:hypothetical protein